MGKKSTKRSECSAVATNLLFEGVCVGVRVCLGGGVRNIILCISYACLYRLIVLLIGFIYFPF